MTFLSFWVVLGIALVLAEFVLPGLVAVFLGAAALTVAACIHLGFVDGIVGQVLVWFGSSLFYIFTIRVFIARIVPSDTRVRELDEDILRAGTIVDVVETILPGQVGRVAHRDSTWNAITHDTHPIEVGTKTRIIERDNITFVVTADIASEAGGES